MMTVEEGTVGSCLLIMHMVQKVSQEAAACSRTRGLVTRLLVQELSCNVQPISLHSGIQVHVVRISRKTGGWKIRKVTHGTDGEGCPHGV